MSADEVAQILIDAGMILEAEGHGDMTRGHVSARSPDDPNLFLMKPHTFGLEEITRENIVLCNLEGERLRGGPRHSEVYIHSEIYKARPDVRCVIHSHPDNAVAFSATGLDLRPLNQPSCIFFEALGLFDETIDLIRTKEQGAGVARALGPHNAALMKCHGVVVAAASVEEAVTTEIMLENACRMQLLTLSSGRVAREYPRADIEALKSKITTYDQHKINFDYLRRKHAGSARRAAAHGAA